LLHVSLEIARKDIVMVQSNCP